MSANVVNSIGLIANMAGVVLVFFFGFPQPSHEAGIGLGLELGTVLQDGRTVARHDEEVRAQKQRYGTLSRVGLGLMFTGFVLQLVATWVGP
jgi:hypothetical protein